MKLNQNFKIGERPNPKTFLWEGYGIFLVKINKKIYQKSTNQIKINTDL